MIASAVLLTSPRTALAQRSLGVDVSQFQGAIDWSVVKAPTSSGGGGKDFAFIRATRGGTWGSSSSSGMDTVGGGRYDDTAFITNISGAQAAGVLAGAYHLARIDLYDPNNPHGAVTPEDEAQHFLEIAGPYMGAGYLRPVLDLEGSNTATPAQLSDYATRFVNTIVAAKGPRASPIVYLNSSFATNEVDASLTTQPLWLARPDANSNDQNGDPIPSPAVSNPYGVWDPTGTASPKPWTFWQYGTPASNHPGVNVPGITNVVDLDVAHGDSNYLQRLLIPTVTWTGVGGNNNWNNNANWNVGKPLQGDTIAFGNSSNTNIRADFGVFDQNGPTPVNQSPLHLQSATFVAGAPAYTIELYSATVSTTSFYQANLVFDGAGVTNQSGTGQTFVVDHGEAMSQYDGSSITFNNSAAAGANVTYHAQGGVTTIQTGQPGTYIFLRPAGGNIFFNDSASAQSATFVVDGGTGNGGRRARVEFHNTSTAAAAIFTNNGGAPASNAPGLSPTTVCGFGGETIFFDTANAGSAHFTNNGTTNASGSGGVTTFTQNSSAANGVFVTNAGTDSNGNGSPGDVQFIDNASADHGNFTNNGGGTFNIGGQTAFFDATTAANGTFTNIGGDRFGGGKTFFHDSATAANGAFINMGGAGTSPERGYTRFYDNSTAGNARFNNKPGGGGSGGAVEFFNNSTAANATFSNDVGGSGVTAGEIQFNDFSTAANSTMAAHFVNGKVTFNGDSTASASTITVDDAAQSTTVQFNDRTKGGSSHITIGGASSLRFNGHASAENATIVVRAAIGDSLVPASLTVSGDSPGDGSIAATLANSIVTLAGGASTSHAGGTATVTGLTSSAGNATISANGGSNFGTGAQIIFSNGGHAGTSTLLANGGTSAQLGAAIKFNSGGAGDSARLVLNGNATADFTGNVSSGTAVGSIEGAGSVLLGGSLLTLGSLNTDTTISGNITGTGGRLTKVGFGALTLTGTDTYTGLTTVAAGTLAVNGSIAGAADVKNGAILRGIGSTGPITVETGGVLAPGMSPGTITVAGLNLTSGSTVQYELGTSRDHIALTNNGSVALGGLLDLSILSGYNPALGDTIPMFEGSIGSITGTFSAVSAPIFNGHTFTVIYGVNQVTLKVSAAALSPGDYNGDGVVDAGDYVVWQKDPNHTQGQYDLWRMHFGQTSPGGGASAGASSAETTVPEPPTALLLLGFVVICFRVRGRFSRSGHGQESALSKEHLPCVA